MKADLQAIKDSKLHPKNILFFLDQAEEEEQSESDEDVENDEAEEEDENDEVENDKAEQKGEYRNTYMILEVES